MVIPNRSDFEKEVELCVKLYPGFAEGKKVILAVDAAAREHFSANPLEPSMVIDIEDSTEKMRNDESLNMHPHLERKSVAELLKKVSQALLAANPKLKKTVKELGAHFDRFAESDGDTASKDEIIDLRDGLIREGLLETDLATFLFSIVLARFYRQHLEQISEVLRTDLWQGGECPLCASLPHYGYLSSPDGAKFFECHLCSTEWQHARVKCPYCSNADHERLGYFTVEGNKVCRVSYCQACCQYYKLFDLRELGQDGKVNLSVHHLASLDYDFLASKEGFTPGSGLEWVNESDLTAQESDRQDQEVD